MYKLKFFSETKFKLIIYFSFYTCFKKIKDDLKSFFDQIDIEYIRYNEKLKKKKLLKSLCI